MKHLFNKVVLVSAIVLFSLTSFSQSKLDSLFEDKKNLKNQIAALIDTVKVTKSQETIHFLSNIYLTTQTSERQLKRTDEKIVEAEEDITSTEKQINFCKEPATKKFLFIFIHKDKKRIKQQKILSEYYKKELSRLDTIKTNLMLKHSELSVLLEKLEKAELLTKQLINTEDNIYIEKRIYKLKIDECNY